MTDVGQGRHLTFSCTTYPKAVNSCWTQSFINHYCYKVFDRIFYVSFFTGNEMMDGVMEVEVNKDVSAGDLKNNENVDT